jgi:3-phosphoshikimate 1-carboxyvinyltransferase
VYHVAPLDRVRREPFAARLPGSKAATHRALVLAAQRMGATRVENGLRCEDTDLLARALDAFEGLSVRADSGGFQVARTRERLGAPAGDLFLGGAGTPARFLLAFACGVDGATVVGGAPRLCERPMADLLQSLRALGIRQDFLSRPEHLPVRIHGGPLCSSDWRVSTSQSSQFASALCLLAAQQPAGPIRIALEGRQVSSPYLDMTLALMRAQGIRAEREWPESITVHPSRPAHAIIGVETDASAMSYFLAAAALTGTTVEVAGIGLGSVQGDVGFARVLERMGCRLTTGGPTSIRLTGGRLRGIDVDLSAMPDVALTLAAVAALAEGTTRIANVAHLRQKESDRIAAAAAGLRSLGVEVEEGPDWLRIEPRGPLAPARIETFGDHRVAMAFAIPGLVSPGIEIADPGCVAKSFPGFWSELERFRAHHLAP